MNAGAFGDETWRHVHRVEMLDRLGQRHQRSPQEFRIGYRQVALAAAGSGLEEWFIAAELQFEPGTSAQVGSVRALTELRRQTQPLGEWSCGSVFRNPPGDHAARLIEAAGLKGYRIGDAVVSDKHANFIINEGHASAQELEQLIGHVQQSVERVFGIRLEPEVRIIGESVSAPAGAQDH
jgi:UDP-N-acetylmuramate dehydrogenase